VITQSPSASTGSLLLTEMILQDTAPQPPEGEALKLTGIAVIRRMHLSFVFQSGGTAGASLPRRYHSILFFFHPFANIWSAIFKLHARPFDQLAVAPVLHFVHSIRAPITSDATESPIGFH
jgi:hypothetical protein